jgi:hypothetical protein
LSFIQRLEMRVGRVESGDSGKSPPEGQVARKSVWEKRRLMLGQCFSIISIVPRGREEGRRRRQCAAEAGCRVHWVFLVKSEQGVLFSAPFMQ